MSNIYFKHHSAGLINQTMSAEIAFSLAFLQQAKLCVYNTKQTQEDPIVLPTNLMSIIPPERRKLYIGSSQPTVFDLLNIPNNISYILDHNKNIDEKYIKDIPNYKNLLSYYYRCGEPGLDEKSFADGRSRLVFDLENDVHLYHYTFPLYSRFFYNRPKSLDNFLSEIHFKKPYQILAKKIAEHIGPFNGFHFRLTDHAKNYDYSKITLDCVMRSFDCKDIPLIISSDDKEMVKNLFKHKCIFIDEIIQKKFGDDFMNLPFHNEIVFGMISLLVMGYSKEFIGTPGSTFSGYIHRLRSLGGLNKKMNYIPSGSIKILDDLGKPYSWNNCDLTTNAKSWYREWPECKLQV